MLEFFFTEKNIVQKYEIFLQTSHKIHGLGQSELKMVCRSETACDPMEICPIPMTIAR